VSVVAKAFWMLNALALRLAVGYGLTEDKRAKDLQPLVMVVISVRLFAPTGRFILA
jgi:hypothetical protein